VKQKGEQFHPARNRRGIGEYELPHGERNEGINLPGSGYYTHDELKDYDRIYKSDPGGYPEMEALQRPAQGRLFDPEKHEAANRQKLGRERFTHLDTPAGEIRDKALQASTIPTTDLRSRPGKSTTFLTSTNDNRDWYGSGVGGWYRGPATKTLPDKIAVDPMSGHTPESTFIHEAGHRQHLGEHSGRLGASELYHHPRGLGGPDPVKEGVADAYVDRYQPGSTNAREMSKDIEAGRGKFPSYQYTGYSSDPERARDFGWKDDARALYAASRAHASETGEQPLYQPAGRHVMEQSGMSTNVRNDPTVDATLHHLLSTSPHAAQALRQTGLKEEGGQAFRRHRDRQLLTEGQSTQESLFSELRGVKTGKVHGYQPNADVVYDNTMAGPGDIRSKAATFDTHVEGMFAHQDQLEAQHGEAVWPHHMSHNQFGEPPRTRSDIGQSLGVSRHYAKQQGFSDTV